MEQFMHKLFENHPILVYFNLGQQIRFVSNLINYQEDFIKTYLHYDYMTMIEADSGEFIFYKDYFKQYFKFANTVKLDEMKRQGNYDESHLFWRYDNSKIRSSDNIEDLGFDSMVMAEFMLYEYYCDNN